jgi:hypothetical protein
MQPACRSDLPLLDGGGGCAYGEKVVIQQNRAVVGPGGKEPTETRAKADAGPTGATTGGPAPGTSWISGSVSPKGVPIGILTAVLYALALLHQYWVVARGDSSFPPEIWLPQFLGLVATCGLAGAVAAAVHRPVRPSSTTARTPEVPKSTPMTRWRVVCCVVCECGSAIHSTVLGTVAQVQGFKNRPQPQAQPRPER